MAIFFSTPDVVGSLQLESPVNRKPRCCCWAVHECCSRQFTTVLFIESQNIRSLAQGN